ncbi:MAG: sirohydrochlorin cobaltochelatase [Lachnospiraceae bacterium]|nr:sirohydrochlorin cobaltochelatase [Lachnospiraceae bacterium]
MKKKLYVMMEIVLLSGTLTVLSACQAGAPAAETEVTDPAEETAENETAESEPAEEEEEPDTGDATLDDPRNQDEIGENEMLVVSFGTSFNDSRRLTIGAIEEALAESEPDFSVRRAFTSQIVIDHVKDRDGETIDNVREALDRAADNGVKKLVVVPTHLMDGLEYNDIVNEVAEYSDAFASVAISKPLLSDDEDFAKVAEAMIAATEEYKDGHTAICFMGHGTEADSNRVYERMQQEMEALGEKDIFIGTVEASPSLEDLLEKVGEGDYTRVVLRPMMVVAGDHANNDMAGDDEDSWKSAFEKAGYEVECVLEGLGQLPEVRSIYAAHAQAAAEEKGADAAVASSEEMAEVVDVVDENAVPVPGSALKDGSYEIDVDSSSSMFRIEKCEITVKDGAITATMTMGGTGYRYVYPGTGVEAVAADEAAYIPYEETSEGKHTFTVPVEALDAGVPLAAFSDKKEKWYDRTLVFRSAKLPAEAYEEGAVKTMDSLELSDGQYQVEVALRGGSGKAEITSPAALSIRNGKATARIEWSSPHYDYMLVNEEKYLPVNEEGNSVFEIPVAVLDAPVTVTADTTAMSEPHEIEYTLTFDSASIHE